MLSTLENKNTKNTKDVSNENISFVPKSKKTIAHLF